MLADFQTLVNDLVRDDAAKVTATQRDLAIAAAVLRYSKDKPVTIPVEVVAPAGKTLNLPAEWIHGFSTLQNVEYPINEVPPYMLANDDFSVRATPGGLKIICADGFVAGSLVWLHITQTHTVSGTVDSIALQDREAVCCLAAASLCDQLAVLFSGDTDSTIQADSVSHQSKAGEYASRAKNLRKRYFDELGIDTKKSVAACAVVGLKSSSSLGRQHLTHNRRTR